MIEKLSRPRARVTNDDAGRRHRLLLWRRSQRAGICSRCSGARSPRCSLRGRRAAPLLGAGELIYLGGLVSLPRYLGGDRCPSRRQSPRADPRSSADPQSAPPRAEHRRTATLQWVAPPLSGDALHRADDATRHRRRHHGRLDTRARPVLYGSCACSATRTACSGSSA